MLGKIGPLLLAAIRLVAGPSHLFAQANTTSIRGVVVDPQNRPVPGATEVVTNTDLSSRRTTVADATGSFTISNLVPASWLSNKTIHH